MSKKGVFSIQAAATDHLPFAPLSPQQIRAILQAFRFAWSEFLAEPEPHGIEDVSNAKEVPISEALLRVLCTIHNAKKPPIPVFSDEFQTPISDAGLRNYNGKKLGTKVDFCFRPKVNPYPGRNVDHYGLFVEAKPISGGELYNYMRNGLVKFLRGDYSWAMTQGMMVAYVQPTSQQLPDALIAYFKRLGNANTFGIQDTPRTWPADRHIPRPCLTVHERTWSYPSPEAPPPGNIEIIHLWLPTNK